MSDEKRERRKARPRAWWLRVVADFEACGEPSREYALRHDLTVTNLRWWVSRIRRERRGDVGGGAGAAATELVEVRVPERRAECGGEGPVLVHLRAGLCVEVPGSADSRRAAELVGHLVEVTRC